MLVSLKHLASPVVIASLNLFFFEMIRSLSILLSLTTKTCCDLDRLCSLCSVVLMDARPVKGDLGRLELDVAVDVALLEHLYLTSLIAAK